MKFLQANATSTLLLYHTLIEVKTIPGVFIVESIGGGIANNTSDFNSITNPIPGMRLLPDMPGTKTDHFARQKKW
jgi:hypothetical protein